MTPLAKLKPAARVLLPLALLSGLVACNPAALDGSDTGPVAGEEACDATVNGDHEITQGGTPEAPLVIDGLCVNDGTTIIDADYVTIQNSQLRAAPPAAPYPLFVDDGHHGIVVKNTVLDCNAPSDEPAQAIGILAESGAKHYDPTLPGLYLDVQGNEVTRCTDGFQLTSNSVYTHNLIHSPAHPIDAHEDGVQFSTEDDGTGIHDTRFNFNRVHFPDTSSAFQYHNNPEQGPEAWPTRLEVDHNVFEGGIAVVRFPGRNCAISVCSGVDLKFYANQVGLLTENEIFLCDGDTGSVAVWGAETGNPDDANINLSTGATLERTC